MVSQTGRNDPCYCGSGKKYKKCHLEQDELRDQKKRQEAALNAAKVAKEKETKEEKSSSQADHTQPKKGWFQKMAGKVGLIKKVSQQRNIPQNKGG